MRLPRASILATALVSGGLLLAIALGFQRPAQADRLWTERAVTTAAMTPDDALARAGFSKLAKELTPAVVFIAVERQPGAPRGFSRPGRGGNPHFHPDGLGTGFIINADGWVVTNNHVVEGAEAIKVRLNNRREYDGTVVGTDPETDIALIKFEPDEALTVAPLGNSDATEIGDWVLAIGNPFGLSHTVTAGIVSAKGRVGVAPDGKRDLYEDFIQTDASINSGNSGGPLINMRGEVIGVNTAINSQGQGIAFAVPISMVKTVLPQLQGGGRVKRSMLGIKIEDVQPEVARQLGLGESSGALVNEVLPGSPAEKGGVRSGDVITSFDGKAIDSSKALRWMASNAGVGRDVAVEVWRDGAARELKVQLGALARAGSAPQETGRDVGDRATLDGLGIKAAAITPALIKKYSLEVRQGVVVTEVLPGSPVAGLGLQPGDVLLKIGSTPLRDVEGLLQALGRTRPGQTITLLMQRGDRQIFRAFNNE